MLWFPRSRETNMGVDVLNELHRAQHAEKVGGEIYRKLLPTLKDKNLSGQFIAIHIDSGDWLVAPTELELIKNYEHRFGGDAPGWVQQIRYDDVKNDWVD